MRKRFISTVIVTLIISLAAPSGAVFASAPDEMPSVASAEVVRVDGVETTEDTKDATVLEKDDVATGEVKHATEPLGGEEHINQGGEPAQERAPLPVEDVPEPELPIDEVSRSNESAKGVIITEITTRGAGGDTDERIELYNASDTPIDITGWCLQREASSAVATVTKMHCIKASEADDSVRVLVSARSFLLFASTVTQTTQPGLGVTGTLTQPGMANTVGTVRLVNEGGQTIDVVGWGAAPHANGFRIAPASAPVVQGESLRRKVSHDTFQDTGNNFNDFFTTPSKTVYELGRLIELRDLCRNIPEIQAVLPEGMIRLKQGDCHDQKLLNLCQTLRINEVAAHHSEQFIELYNTANVGVDISGCGLRTNRSQTVTYLFPDTVLAAHAYLVVNIRETTLKLTKSTTGTVYLFALGGEIDIDTVSYEDLSSETSWAYFDDGWRQTHDVSPNAENRYQQLASCPDGQERNEATGRCRLSVSAVRTLTPCRDDQYRSEETNRCRSLTAARTLVPCREGHYRSEETNRCRSIASAVSSLKPCADDQFRNPLTNRCKKIASTDDLADCGEGRERNPATNRCRAVLVSTPPELGYGVETVAQSASTTIGWWVAGSIALLAVGYAGWEWREEIGRMIRKVRLPRSGRH